MTAALLVVGSLIVLLLASLLWKTRSLTQSTKPTPTSDASESSTTLTTISQMFLDMQRETRTLVVDLVQGRPQPPPTTPREIEQTEIERLNTYDYDQTPLSPGIEQIAQREAEEELLEASLRERRASQERIREIEQRLMEERELQDSIDQSLPGPWRADHLDQPEP